MEGTGGPAMQLELSCDAAGGTIAAIDWASYGTLGCEPTTTAAGDGGRSGGGGGGGGNCRYPPAQMLEQWKAGSCTPARFAAAAKAAAVPCPHANTSRAVEVLGKACVGKKSCTVELSSATFGPADPCFGGWHRAPSAAGHPAFVRQLESGMRSQISLCHRRHLQIFVRSGALQFRRGPRCHHHAADRAAGKEVAADCPSTAVLRAGDPCGHAG